MIWRALAGRQAGLCPKQRIPRQWPRRSRRRSSRSLVGSRRGKDVNWPCVARDKHELDTHPSDVVQAYQDPYEDAKVFLNVDLKSYAVGSLKKAQVRGAVTSLCKAADCANVSSGWRNLYGDNTSNYRCHGLLFVYNHNGDYDGDFEKFFEFMDTKDAPLEASNRVFVFSPATVSYLATVANDLRGSRGMDRLPSKKEYSFYYPDLIGTRPRSRTRQPLPLRSF